MALTTRGYPYPLGTDRVMDGDDAIKALAEAIDSKLGAIAAGTTTIPVTAANTTATVTVTFAPPLPMVPKAILMSVATLTNGPGSTSMWSSAPTATNVVLAGQRTSASTFPCSWLAIA